MDERMNCEDSDIQNSEEADLICSLKETEKEFQKLQEEFKKLKTTKQIDKDQDPTLAISQNKEIELLAELKVLQQKRPCEIKVCYPLIIELVENHLKKQEQGLKQTLEALRNQTTMLKDEEQKFEQIVKEENHLISILEKELVEKESQSESSARKIEQLQVKLSNARRLRKKRMQETRLFLQMYFPLPERATLLKHMNKGNYDKNGELNIMPLGELLELLLNAMLKKPYDPWITIDDRMWPPYIELLLRYNIVIRHPEKCTLIKLETQLS